jgi:hypothetical protein
MQIDINPQESKQVNGPFATWQHGVKNEIGRFRTGCAGSFYPASPFPNSFHCHATSLQPFGSQCKSFAAELAVMLALTS